MTLTTTAAVTMGSFWLFAVSCAWANENEQRGRKLSEQHCSRCHVIGNYNKYGGIGSTPSFQLLVNHLPDYKERFETFFTRRPHPAFLTIEGTEKLQKHIPANAQPIELPLSAVADILAFAETLHSNKTPK